MKKDILAALTFLTTALLFYVARTDGMAAGILGFRDQCSTHETVLVNQKSHTPPGALVLQEHGTRDS